MADNISILDGTGTPVVKATKDLGSGIQADKQMAVDSTGAEVMGVVTASPTANTVLARLKDILTNTVLAAGEAHLGKVGGESIVATASVTRPADTTPYSIGDLVAGSTVAASVSSLTFGVARINAGTGVLIRARLSTTKTGLVGNEAFRLHLFRIDPTTLTGGVANGDNGAFSVKGVGAVHIGFFDIILDRVFVDGAKGIGVPAAGSQMVFNANTGTTNIFGLIEARNNYTPISGEIFTADLEVLRD